MAKAQRDECSLHLCVFAFQKEKLGGSGSRWARCDFDMTYLVFEADINHGHVTVKEPEKLPEQARGLLIVLPDPQLNATTIRPRSRVKLPLIRGEGQQKINPTPEELDSSFEDEPRS